MEAEAKAPVVVAEVVEEEAEAVVVVEKRMPVVLAMWKRRCL